MLYENYNVIADHITKEILKRAKGATYKKILVGDLFGTKKENVYYVMTAEPTRDEGAFSYSDKKPFPQYPYEIWINYTKNEDKLYAALNHEVNHIVTHQRSKGHSSDAKKNIVPRKIKNYKEINDNGYSKEILDYLKNADELNAFFNSFASLLRGKKFKNIEEIYEFLKVKLSSGRNDLRLMKYYFFENKATKRYFLKKFHREGIMEEEMKEEFMSLVKEEMEKNRYYITTKNKKNKDVEDELSRVGKPIFHGTDGTHICNVYKTPEGMFVIEMAADDEASITYRKIQDIDLDYFRKKYNGVKTKKELKEENKMRFADVKEMVITEDEISTLYKGPDCRIVKAGNKFEAIFADVPRDKISNNTHFPYINGANEGANIEKITLNDNDIIQILFTNGKVNKYTKVAIDKKGNQVLQRAVAKLFTAREKA